MHHALSIPAAAELCGVGEPAIRRAIRDGRIKPAFFWHVGGHNALTYVNLYSAIECYGIDQDGADELIKRWMAHASIVRVPDGREWLILDQTAPMMFLEGSSSADWVNE